MIQSNKNIQNFHRSSNKLALSKSPKRTSKKSIKNENLYINTNNSNTKIKHNIINEKKIEKNSSSECFSEESGSKEKKINNNNNKLNNNKSISSFKDLLRKEKKYIIKNHYILSKAGKDDSGSMKINQDSYLFLPKVNGLKDFNIFGVLDGHGPEGHYVSQFVSRYFQLEFNNKEFIGNIKDINLIYQKISSNNFRMIRDLFINADNLLHDQEIESRNSGTTCVLVIHIGEHIICANTGDSRAILIYDKNKKNEFKVFPLSIDCKPELKEEKERIKKMGGIVEKIKNKNGKEIGPYRVWNKTKEYPGLAMSRSIGDFNGKNVGIIPDPQIIETNFGININYIVICSDGVWEFLKNDDIMKIGNKYYKENNPHDFCKEVVDLATKCWQKSDDIVDDITMVTAFF
jgi:serine/threonine protein phosphatase PrpC